MRRITIAVGISALTAGVILLGSAAEREPDRSSGKQFILRSVGSVQKEDGRTTLVLDKDVEPALLGLDGWSHVWVFWWFDKNDTPKKRAVLQVHPRANKENPLTGVFACRAPMRPNLIAQTLCKVLSVEGNVVEVEKIDAFAGTPLLDLKPYAPGIDSAKATVPKWTKLKRE